MKSNVMDSKKRNPREGANIFAIVTFLYTLPHFFKGREDELQEVDLYQTLSQNRSSYLGDKLEQAWNQELTKASQQKTEPSLSRALLKTFRWNFVRLGMVHIIYDICGRISQSLFLYQLLRYYAPGQTEISKLEAYLYATGVCVCSLLVVLLTHPVTMGEYHLGLKFKVACCSLMYRKVLKLDKSAYQETTVGQIINLLSNDVQRFDTSFTFVNYLWIGPLQTIIIFYLMYNLVEIGAVCGMIVVLVWVPLQLFLAMLTSKLRLKTAIRTDERVRLMSEVIKGIQVIKMYTWEKPFECLISSIRKSEIHCIRATSYLKGIYSSFPTFTSRTALFVTILIYILPEDRLISAELAYFLTALYNVTKNSMTELFPSGLAQFAEMRVSIKRIQTFLMYGDIPTFKSDFDDTHSQAVVIKNGSSKWVENSAENIFEHLNFKIEKRQLVAVIGPVGSGKSSLFNVILKELPLIKGTLNVNGTISYASQEPWLFSGNVQQNILFGEEMNRTRYETVVIMCALKKDFKLFPYGDKTIVGERGISLSGGQRARINLARAVYRNADIYLLDDPLSAVDTKVGKHIFDKCIREFLGSKTVILITHQLQYLKDVDKIVIFKDGEIVVEGKYDQLSNSGLDFAQYMKTDEEDEDKKLTKKISVTSQISSDKESDYNVKNLEAIEEPAEVQEHRSEGTVSKYVYMSYVKAIGSWCSVFILVVFLLGSQGLTSLVDYFVSYWVNLQQDSLAIRTSQEPVINNDSFWNFSKQTSIYIYATLILLLMIMALIRSFTFYSLCMKASINLHKSMFNSIIRATMYFYNTNSSGRILNRFSKDIGTIDEQLPIALVAVTQIFLIVFASTLLIIIVNPWLVIPITIIVILFGTLRRFYLKTSRAIKRLDGITKSSVYGHLSTTLEGISTIRAFGAEEKLKKEFDKYQDLNSSASFSYLSSSIAFGYWLDLISVVYITTVTMSFFIFQTENYGGYVGLAITQAISLTGMFPWGMKQSTELENQMTSVERVCEYINSIDPEPPLESSLDKKPPKNWPKKGKIEFKDVCLKYSVEEPAVLKCLNFTIKPLEKVGIVGRTGAGKSSIITALFRLAQTEGSILIDGIQTGELGLHDVRSKISIIPQEPVLYSSTVRKNLDPFDKYDDATLWSVLEEVELKPTIVATQEGLDYKITESGKNLSLGQRQLVCLARAILQNNKILIMDEATANVDFQTDSLIQKTIQRKFADCTVLTIAHRLNTVIGADRILVMNAGEMVEFERPHILLQNKKGYFYRLVMETGKTMSTALILAAQEESDLDFPDTPPEIVNEAEKTYANSLPKIWRKRYEDI